jgi:hypothetical protein
VLPAQRQELDLGHRVCAGGRVRDGVEDQPPPAGPAQPVEHPVHVPDDDQPLLERGRHHGPGVVVGPGPLRRVDDRPGRLRPRRTPGRQEVGPVPRLGAVHDHAGRDRAGPATPGNQDVDGRRVEASQTGRSSRAEAGQHRRATRAEHGDPSSLRSAERSVVGDVDGAVRLLPSPRRDAVPQRLRREVVQRLGRGDDAVLGGEEIVHTARVAERPEPCGQPVDNSGQGPRTRSR